MPRFHADAAFWRELAWLGSTRGPRFWLRHSPTPIGLAFAAASTKQRAHVAASLRSVLGPRTPAIEALEVARVFVQFAHCLAESLAVSRTDRYKPQVDVEGVGPLLQALEGGQGAIVATAHSAGWEVALGALHRTTGLPVLVAMLPEREGEARSFHPEVGSNGVVRVVTVGDDPLAALAFLSHLRRGGIVALQVDRCPASMRALQVPGGRRTWNLPAGPFVLAATAGVPVVVVLTRRLGFLHYGLVAHEAIRLPRRPSQTELLEAAAAAARILSAFVLRHPDQWFDFAPR